VIITRTLRVVALALSMAAELAAQGTARQLNAAREVYASARYEEALALLDGIKPADPASPDDGRALQQYRSLCLLALGRAADAEVAIAALVTADPMYQPGEADASPRVRAAFSEVRRRVLPTIAMSQYAVAKRLYDKKEFAAAAAELQSLLRLLDDPDMKGQQGDLRVLASGFLELSVSGNAPAQKTNADAAAAPVQPSAPEPAADRVYTQEHPGVTPAVPVKQELPRVPSSIAAQVRERGVVEIVIDELGRVTFVSIRSSLHPMYDNLLLNAAREWRYRPATCAGAAVKFRKLIQISLAKR